MCFCVIDHPFSRELNIKRSCASHLQSHTITKALCSMILCSRDVQYVTT